MLRDLAPNSQFDPMPEDYLTSIFRASVRGAGDLALAVGPSVAIMAEGVVAAHSRVVSESVWGDRTVLSIPRGEVALDDECPSSSGCPSCDPADDRGTSSAGVVGRSSLQQRFLGLGVEDVHVVHVQDYLEILAYLG